MHECNCPDGRQEAYDDGKRDGAAAERAAVVAYLRRLAAERFPSPGPLRREAIALDEAAELIESGEHVATATPTKETP